jgi:hypothetical protein
VSGSVGMLMKHLDPYGSRMFTAHEELSISQGFICWWGHQADPNALVFVPRIDMILSYSYSGQLLESWLYERRYLENKNKPCHTKFSYMDILLHFLYLFLGVFSCNVS